MMKYLLDGMDTLKKEIDSASKKVEIVDSRIHAIKVLDAKVDASMNGRGENEVRIPNKGKEICHAIEGGTTTERFRKPITEFELGGTSQNLGNLSRTEEMALTISLQTSDHDLKEERRAIKRYFDQQGCTKTTAPAIPERVINQHPTEDEDTIHMPTSQYLERGCTSQPTSSWGSEIEQHNRFEIKEPPDRRIYKTTPEELHQELDETHDLVIKELQPIDAETSKIRLNLLKALTTKQKHMEKVMQNGNRNGTTIPHKMPEKLEDPGSFSIPCIINNVSFPRCLIDLGASISIMPYTTAKRLKFRDFKETNHHVVMANNSIKFPVGVLEDVPVQIGRSFVFTNFMVLDMDEEPPDPILLGRPFMATTKMKIDIGGSQMELNLGDHTATFARQESRQQPPKHPDTCKESGQGLPNNVPLGNRLIGLDEQTGGTELRDIYLEWLKGLRKRKSTEADRADPGTSKGRLTYDCSNAPDATTGNDNDTPLFIE